MAAKLASETLRDRLLATFDLLDLGVDMAVSVRTEPRFTRDLHALTEE